MSLVDHLWTCACKEWHKFSVPWWHIFQLRLNKSTLHLLVSVLILKTLFFCGLFSPTYSAFCWWFHWLKWCPSALEKWYLLFLNIRRLWCVLWRKDMYQIGFMQAWVMVLLAMISKLMNQWYVLYKMSFLI